MLTALHALIVFTLCMARGDRGEFHTEAVGLSLLAIGAVLFSGAAWGGVTGLYVGVAARALHMTRRVCEGCWHETGWAAWSRPDGGR